VEASLQQEAKATASGFLTFVGMHKQRRRVSGSDIHSLQAGPVVRDSPLLQRHSVLSRMEGDRWQIRKIWWCLAGEARKSLTKNQSGYN
jgi:hypothetical protein